jgi:hypothetical protein
MEGLCSSPILRNFQEPHGVTSQKTPFFSEGVQSPAGEVRKGTQSMICRQLLRNVNVNGYITPVRTSQETHYVSTTEPSQLMQCKI